MRRIVTFSMLVVLVVLSVSSALRVNAEAQSWECVGFQVLPDYTENMLPTLNVSSLNKIRYGFRGSTVKVAFFVRDNYLTPEGNPIEGGGGLPAFYVDFGFFENNVDNIINATAGAGLNSKGTEQDPFLKAIKMTNSNIYQLTIEFDPEEYTYGIAPTSSYAPDEPEDFKFELKLLSNDRLVQCLEKIDSAVTKTQFSIPVPSEISYQDVLFNATAVNQFLSYDCASIKSDTGLRDTWRVAKGAAERAKERYYFSCDENGKYIDTGCKSLVGYTSEALDGFCKNSTTPGTKSCNLCLVEIKDTSFAEHGEICGVANCTCKSDYYYNFSANNIPNFTKDPRTVLVRCLASTLSLPGSGIYDKINRSDSVTIATRSQVKCVVGAAECDPTGNPVEPDGIGSSVFSCKADGTEEFGIKYGSCVNTSCGIAADKLVEENASCTTAVNLSGEDDKALCVKLSQNNSTTGGCISNKELVSALKYTGIYKDLILKVEIDRARLAIMAEDGLTPVPVIIPVDPAVNISPAAGPCNCPGLRPLCLNGGVFSPDALADKTSSEIKSELNDNSFIALSADEKAAAVSCFTCVGAGNTWTDSFGCISTTVAGLFTSLLRIALGVIGGIILIRLIALGYQYAFSSEKMKLEEAVKNVLAILGSLLIVLFSVVILRIIGVNILDVVPPGFF